MAFDDDDRFGPGPGYGEPDEGEYGDGYEDPEDFGDGDSDGGDGGDNSTVRSIIKWSVVGVVAVVVILVGVMLFSGGDDGDAVDPEVTRQEGYDEGYNKAKAESDAELSQARQDLDGMRSTVQDQSDKISSLNQTIQDAEKEKQDLINEAQEKINQVAKQRDKLQDQLDKAGD